MKRSPGNRRRRGAFRFHTPNSRTQTHCSGAGDFLERRGNRSVRCKLFGVPREDPAVRPPAAGRPVSRPCRWVSQRQAPVAVVLPPPPCGHGRTVGGGKRPIGQNPPGGARVRGRRTNPGAHLRKGSPVRWSKAASAGYRASSAFYSSSQLGSLMS